MCIRDLLNANCHVIVVQGRLGDVIPCLAWIEGEVLDNSVAASQDVLCLVTDLTRASHCSRWWLWPRV